MFKIGETVYLFGKRKATVMEDSLLDAVIVRIDGEEKSGVIERRFVTRDKPEMTAREFQKEALRMANSVLPGGFDFGCDRAKADDDCTENCPKYEMHSCAGQIETDSVLLDPYTIEIVQRWSAEHPKPAPISAADYKLLKALNVVFGDVWITSDKDGVVGLHGNKPEKENDGWVSSETSPFSPDFSNLVSWQDTEPLHLTADWLKEVEHEPK